MKLNETIAGLRREQGMTQETVADALGVSIAAVSKWETAAAYPDIELLPKIAALFDVSLDYLMDFTRTASGTVEEHIAHAYELVKMRDNRGADEYLTAVLARYPENNLLKIECAQIKRIRTCGTSDTPKSMELLEDAEKLLKSVRIRELNRQETDLYYAALASVYTVWKRFDEASAALDAIMPDRKFNPEQQKYYLELERGNMPDAIAGMQKMMFRGLHDIIVTSSWYYAAYPDQPEKILEQQVFLVRLLDAVTTEIPSPFDRDLAYTWECIALMNVKLGQFSEAVDAILQAAMYGERFDSLENMTYTVLPCFALLNSDFDRSLDYHPHGTGSLASLIAHIVKNAGPEREDYTKIREDSRLQELFRRYC